MLGNTYFWKFLYTCDSARLEETTGNLCSVLSDFMGHKYSEVQPAPEERATIQRWSEGSFNGPGEPNLRFPRMFYVFQWLSGSIDERWIADIFFTRIPHIRGIYSNKSHKHIIDLQAMRKLSVRLMELDLADVFICASDKRFLGKVAGLYVYHKLQHIAALKECAETSRYVPPHSDLRELLESLSTILQENNRSPVPTEIPHARAQIRAFLDACDRRVISSLGSQQLQKLLEPVDLPVRAWLNAGKGRILPWL